MAFLNLLFREFFKSIFECSASKVLSMQTRGPELDLQNSHIKEPGTMVHTWNPGAGEMELGGSLGLVR